MIDEVTVEIYHPKSKTLVDTKQYLRFAPRFAVDDKICAGNNSPVYRIEQVMHIFGDDTYTIRVYTRI